MKKIKVMLADDNDGTRASIRQLLELDNVIDVVGEARTGKEVINKISAIDPEVIIMDLNMPEMDGLETTSYISMNSPDISVIIISINDEIQYFRKAMMAGAKEYLVKPLSPEELNSTIKKIAELGRAQFGNKNSEAQQKQENNLEDNHGMITVFSTKGGVGKSVICTNLAVAAAEQTKQNVSLIDLDIQFGDVSVMLNISPRKTISELVQEGDAPNWGILEEYLYERHKVNVLAAPNRPEYAELVSAQYVKQILSLNRKVFDYTFIDTPAFIDEVTLTALEMSDLILLVISLDLPTIKNVKKGLDILQSLQMISKTRLILNRSSGIAGIEPRDVERVLDMKIKAEVPSDGKLVVSSLNQGIPFVKMNPRAPVSKGIYDILKLLGKNQRSV